MRPIILHCALLRRVSTLTEPYSGRHNQWDYTHEYIFRLKPVNHVSLHVEDIVVLGHITVETCRRNYNVK